MAIKSEVTRHTSRASGAFSPVMFASFAAPVVIFGVAVAYAPVSTLTISALIGTSIALTMACPTDSPDYFSESTDDYVAGLGAEELAYEYNTRPYDDPQVYTVDVEIA